VLLGQQRDGLGHELGVDAWPGPTEEVGLAVRPALRTQDPCLLEGFDPFGDAREMQCFGQSGDPSGQDEGSVISVGEVPGNRP